VEAIHAIRKIRMQFGRVEGHWLQITLAIRYGPLNLNGLQRLEINDFVSWLKLAPGKPST